MDIKITEKLKEYRRQQGNTQEELTNHLNISVETVSKWERGESFSDISLLPAIACFCHVSVDELLGCEEAQREKKRREYGDLWLAYGQKGKTEEVDRLALIYKRKGDIENARKYVDMLPPLECTRNKTQKEVLTGKNSVE